MGGSLSPEPERFSWKNKLALTPALSPRRGGILVSPARDPPFSSGLVDLVFSSVNLMCMNTTASAAPTQQFDWPLANESERFLREQISDFLQRNAFARILADRMREETGTDIFEWTDHLVLPASMEEGVRAAGFVPEHSVETPNQEIVF